MIHDFCPDAKILFHTCGGIETILFDLIDIGINIVNPVQVSAKGMDSQFLKKKYKNKVCFWGAVDTQKVLWKETTDKVKKEVE